MQMETEAETERILDFCLHDTDDSHIKALKRIGIRLIERTIIKKICLRT